MVWLGLGGASPYSSPRISSRQNYCLQPKNARITFAMSRARLTERSHNVPTRNSAHRSQLARTRVILAPRFVTGCPHSWCPRFLVASSASLYRLKGARQEKQTRASLGNFSRSRQRTDRIDQRPLSSTERTSSLSSICPVLSF